MNSKSNVEKDLLQQITYLTRLIEQTSNSSSKSQNQRVNNVPNRNLSKSFGNVKNKDVIAKHNAAESLFKSSTSVLQECKDGILTYTKLKALNKKVNDPQKLMMVNKMKKIGIVRNESDKASESSQPLNLNPVNSYKHNVNVKVESVKDFNKSSPLKSIATPSVELNLLKKRMNELEKLAQNKIKGVESATIKDNNITESSDTNINIAVKKKSIHVNRKVLFENLKSENSQQSLKNCVHLNPAKLQLKTYKNQTEESGTSDLGNIKLECVKNEKILSSNFSDKAPVPVRKVVHINPKFDKHLIIKQKAVSFDSKTDTLSVDSLKSNKSDKISCPKICGNPVPKIHVNKNFISESTVLGESSISVNNKMNTSFEVQNSKNVDVIVKNQNDLSSYDLNTKNVLTGDGSKNDDTKGNTEVIPSLSYNKKKSHLPVKNKYCVNNVNKRLINSRLTACNNPLKFSKFRLQLKDQKNKTMIYKQSQNAVVKKFLIQRNTSSLPMRKYKYRNKMMIVNKNNLASMHKKLNNIQTNNSPMSSSYVTNCISRNLKLVNKTKQVQPRSHPILKRSNSNSKLLKLIKLSKTKLVRAKSNSSPSTSKNTNVKAADTKSKNQNSLSMKRNKRVWIAPNKSLETNVQKKKIRTTTANSSPYKYNSVRNSNKLTYVRVNTPLKNSSRKIVSSPKNEKNLGNIPLNLTKGKYGVQKQRTLIRRLSQTNLVSVSRTKLVRRSKHDIRASKNVFRCNNLANSKTLSLNNRVTKPTAQMKISPTLRTARSVKSKYKLIRNSNLNRAVYNWSHISKRNLKNNFNTNLKTKINNGLSLNSARHRKRSLTIGGIKYHSTKTKLLRKFPVKEGKIFANRIFKNKGESYQVSKRGRCLRRINCPDIYHRLLVNNINRNNSRYRYNAIQRLDFAHSKVAQAKQRSIALLTRKLRKSNEPCLIFNRLGRCSGHERGVCNRLHDKKRVAICKKFLQGTCEKKECLLSHDVGPSKMPTCRHYLAGVCTRDDCPYLHVKVNSSAPICIQFLQGYCPDAEKCKKRHTAMCPEYEEKGVCSKGKSCPYPHPKLIKSHPKDISTETVCTEKIVPVVNFKTEVDGNKSEEVSDNDLKTNRYYCAQEFVMDSEVTTSKRANDENLEDSLVTSDWLRKRPKIGDLPGFIPLDADSNQS